MLRLDHLNQMAVGPLSGNLLERYIPFEGLLDEVVEVHQISDSVFSLNSLTAGLLKTVESSVEASSNNIAIIRIPISYSTALKIQNDLDLFNFQIYNLVNKVLGAFKRKLGNMDEKWEIRADVRGMPGHFFRECENLAAVELRFFATIKPSLLKNENP